MSILIENLKALQAPLPSECNFLPQIIAALEAGEKAQAQIAELNTRLAAVNRELDELGASFAALLSERELIADYLWPNQTGLPNEHRNCLIAIRRREELMHRQLEEAKRQIERERDYRKRFPLMDAKWLDPECHEGCKSLVIKAELQACQRRESGLRIALDKCAERFGDYKAEHLKTQKFEKAARNRDMEDMCRKALAESPVQAPMKYCDDPDNCTYSDCPTAFCDARKAGPPCRLPPKGWKCTRGAGHEGPCAAVPIDEPPQFVRLETAQRLADALKDCTPDLAVWNLDVNAVAERKEEALAAFEQEISDSDFARWFKAGVAVTERAETMKEEKTDGEEKE